MLPKVSAALSKFVSPIQTSSGSSSAHQKEFVRTQPGQQRRPSGGRPDSGRGSQQSHAAPKALPAEEAPEAAPVSHPGTTSGSVFLQLISTLKQRHDNILRWLGVRGYQAGVRSRKRSGRKGAMLDVRVD